MLEMLMTAPAIINSEASHEIFAHPCSKILERECLVASWQADGPQKVRAQSKTYVFEGSRLSAHVHQCLYRKYEGLYCIKSALPHATQ